MKKTIICILTIALLISVTGCQKDSGQNNYAANDKIVMAIQRDNTGTIRSITDKFTEENPDIRVKIIELSDESVENHRILSSVLAGNEVNVDVMAVEDIWINEFINLGYIRKLDDYLKTDIAMYPKKFSDIIYRDGGLYAIPLMLDVGVMFYRNDLSDGKMSYVQLLDSNRTNYSIQGLDKEEMICVVQECIRLCGDAKEGLKTYKRLIESSKYTSDKYLTDFKNGESAYARSWTSNYIQLVNDFSKIQGKVKVSLLNEGGREYSTARAYCLALNAALDDKKAADAEKLLKYFLKEETQLEIAKGTGTLPLKHKYYSIPLVCDYNEYNERFANYIDNLNYRSLNENYSLYSEKAQEAIKKYVNNEGGIDEAAEAVLKTME